MIEQPPRRLLEFGQFSVDTREKLLLRNGTPLPVAPKVFEVLLVLVENRGRTVGKDELIDLVWPNTFVEAGNINRSISTLRSVLGDDRHEPRFIKTFPKRGYRFDADVREVLEENQVPVVETRQKHGIAAEQAPSLNSRGVRSANAHWLAVAIAFVSLVAIAVIVWAGSSPIWTSIDRGAVAQNRDAFDLFRQGRILWQDRTGESLHRATLLLEQAVAVDPDFALARAALADAYVFDGRNWTKAEETALQAIKLDPTLGEPHATIGFLKMFWEWRLAEADTHFRRAISLSPDYATGHQWYSINLMAMGKGHQALAEMKRALELEPDSLAISSDLCRTYYFNRRLDDAETQCKRALEKDRNSLNANLYLYEVYMSKGMYDEAVTQFFRNEELVAHYSTFPGELSRLRAAYQTGGIRSYWQKRVEMLSKLASADYAIALYYARLGENDNVFQYLAKARSRRDLNYLNFVAEPLLGNCCFSDPRYGEMTREMLGED